MSQAAFDHLVFTRFSAVFIPGQDPPDEEWLWYRLAFFVDAGLPSFGAQQGHAGFTWLVYFDDRCSHDFRAAVDELAADGVFEPIWTHEVFWEHIRDEAQRRGQAPHLISTRVDSDDAVAIDFIASIQEQFAGQESIFVNFQNGLQIDRTGGVYSYREPTGPFQSYIEKRTADRPRTIFRDSSHNRSRTYAPLVEVKSEPMWIQVIHGSNISNGVRGVRVAPEVVARRFVLDLQYRHDVPRSTLLAEKVRSYGWRAKLWSSHWYHVGEWMDSTVDRVRGTNTKPAREGLWGPPITSRLLATRLGRKRTERIRDRAAVEHGGDQEFRESIR